MDRNKILEILSNTLLWEVISAKLEEINQVSVMLKDIGYLDDKENTIDQINQCEIFDSEPLKMMEVSVQEGKVLINFETSFILSAWHNNEPLLRITAFTAGKCSIPDVEVFDWEKIEVEKMSKNELLENKMLIEMIELNYIGVECDDLRVL